MKMNEYLVAYSPRTDRRLQILGRMKGAGVVDSSVQDEKLKRIVPRPLGGILPRVRVRCGAKKGFERTTERPETLGSMYLAYRRLNSFIQLDYEVSLASCGTRDKSGSVIYLQLVSSGGTR